MVVVEISGLLRDSWLVDQLISWLVECDPGRTQSFEVSYEVMGRELKE